jgi:hypothetical protein
MAVDVYQDFLDRALSQFEESTELLKLFEAIYDQVQDSQDLVDYLEANLNVDDAEGVWLDILGDLVGLPRPYADEARGAIFTAKLSGEVDDPALGCYDSATGSGGYIQTWSGINVVADSSTTVSDAEYRKQIKAKGIANHVSGIPSDFYNFLKTGFNVESDIDDSTVGLIEITIYDYLSQKERRFVEEKGPRQAGTQVEIINWP